MISIIRPMRQCSIMLNNAQQCACISIRQLINIWRTTAHNFNLVEWRPRHVNVVCCGQSYISRGNGHVVNERWCPSCNDASRVNTTAKQTTHRKIVSQPNKQPFYAVFRRLFCCVQSILNAFFTSILLSGTATETEWWVPDWQSLTKHAISHR